MTDKIDIFDIYKPFRNYMRQFSLIPSLAHLWLYAEHITNGKPLPNNYDFRDQYKRRIDMKALIYQWDLDILFKELVLNAGNAGRRTLGNWGDLARAIQYIRDIDNEISIRKGGGQKIFLEMHRIAHRQLP
jgi:hypothetical protein